MYTLVLVIHVIVCVFLIFVVLVQSSKGAELGAAFGGGSSQTLFGSRGAATFLSKLTTVAAIVFMITSLSLAILSVKRSSVIPEKLSPQSSPIKSLPDTTSGPLQENSSSPKGETEP
jgi:preprotein translocase subunit SecG